MLESVKDAKSSTASSSEMPPSTMSNYFIDSAAKFTTVLLAAERTFTEIAD
jgi:hypothetical protein